MPSNARPILALLNLALAGCAASPFPAHKACDPPTAAVQREFDTARAAVNRLGHEVWPGVRLCVTGDLPTPATSIPGEVLVNPAWAARVPPTALRFVMAHELGHQLQSVGGLVTVVHEGESSRWAKEYQADSVAAQALRGIGEDPVAAARAAFTSFGQPFAVEWATHPSLDERLSAIK